MIVSQAAEKRNGLTCFNITKNHYMFIISQLWLTSQPRSTVIPLDTGTPATSREIYSEGADDGIGTRNPSVINRVL